MIKLLKVLLIIVCSMGFTLSQELHILYTQNTNGVLQNCHCPANPLGGMEKRAAFVAQWRSEYPNTLLFDSGDLLSFNSDIVSDAKILRAVDALNYSAVNIGDQEFSNGIQFLQSNINTSEIPWVASNLRITNNSSFNVPTLRIINVAELNVLVMGVIDSESFQFFHRIYGDLNLDVSDPIKAVQEAYNNAIISSRIDLVILLSNLGYDEDLHIPLDLDFIDIIIGGHTQNQFEIPVVAENTIITQCGKNGEYLGHLELQFEKRKLIAHSGELIPMDLSIKDDEAMLKLISE